MGPRKTVWSPLVLCLFGPAGKYLEERLAGDNHGKCLLRHAVPADYARPELAISGLDQLIFVLI
jgi:hypothetical protein